MKKKGSFIAAIGLSLALSTSVFAATPFTDLDGSYAEDEITALQDYGVVEGDGDGTFRPTDNITREEFAKMLCTTMGLEEFEEPAAAFTDVSDWAKGYVGTLVELDIVKGYNDTKFGGRDHLTREDMVTILVRSLCAEELATFAYEEEDIISDFEDEGSISDYAKANVALSKAIGLVKGNGINFLPKDNAERQAVARLIYELIVNGEEVYEPQLDGIYENLDAEHQATINELYDFTDDEEATVDEGTTPVDEGSGDGEVVQGEV